MIQLWKEHATEARELSYPSNGVTSHVIACPLYCLLALSGSEPDHSPGLQGYCTRITLFVEAVNWFLAREVWVSWRWWKWRLLSSRMWRRIVWNIRTDVSDERPAFGLRVDTYSTPLKMEAADFSETSTPVTWLNGIIPLKTVVFWFLAYLRMNRLYRPREIGFSDMEEYHKCWAVNEVEQIVLGVFETVIPEICKNEKTTKWRWVVIFTLRLFYPWRSSHTVV